MKKIILLFTIAFFATNGFAQAPTNGLIGYYGFENNYSNQDNSQNFTNANSGLSNIPFVTGKYGNGVSFNGISQYLVNSGSINTALNNPNYEFTISFWQKSNAATNTYATSYELFGSQFFRKNVTINNEIGIATSPTAFFGATCNPVANAVGVWKHYTIVVKSPPGTIEKWIYCYIDGVFTTGMADMVGGVGYQGAMHRFNTLATIGAGTDATGNLVTSKRYNGIIDEFYIYNRALTDAEIVALRDDADGIPVISTPAITNISHTTTTNSATINYSLNANNSNTTSIVKYGLTSTSLTNQVSGSVASGTTTSAGAATISGLLSSTTYYYQIEATNSNGTTTTSIGNFTTSAQNSLTDGLLAFYSFENNINSHNNVHNLTNSATPNPQYVTGKYGQGVNFGNGGGALTNTSMSATFNTAEYSIAFWEKRTTNTIPFSSTFELFGSNFFRVSGTGINNGFKINSNINWANDNVAYAATYANTWTHYAFTWGITSDGLKHMSFYVNGSLVGISAVGYLSDALLEKFNSVIAIGNGTNADGSIHVQKAYTGMLDEFYIYNRAITASEVTLLMNNTPGVALSNENFNDNNLKATIYPNPTSNNFVIEMKNEVKSVEIYSLQGQKVMTSLVKNVNVSNLSKGTYLVRIEDENNAVSTQKLIVK